MATHLNGDETQTFGGLYAAATVSSMFRTRKLSFEDALGYAFIIDYSKKGKRNRHNISGKFFEPNKVTFLKMADILENETMKIYTVPLSKLEYQRNKKFSDAVE